ncbi:MAG: hypothetical protein M1514_01350 [Patescibacteria group bacterium]|nr:hypothetical protein [Patescibacteria group bacterium]
MLTKQDLKAIGGLMDQGVSQGNKPLAQKMDGFEKRLDSLDQKFEKNLRPIKKDIEIVIGFFNSEKIHLKKRMDRIEDHLGLPPLARSL